MTTVDVQQRTDAWYEARRGMATCSRFKSIITAVNAAPSSAQDALINELLAESVLPPQEGLVRGPITGDMEFGMRLEGEARCYYDLNFADAPVSEVGFMIHSSQLFGGSPDALVGDAGGVEIKVPAVKTHIQYLREGVLPDGYKQQLHGYMAVSGRDHWDFFSYCRHFPPFRLRVERGAYTAKLELEVLAFCQRYNAERIKFGLPPIGSADARKGAAA